MLLLLPLVGLLPMPLYDLARSPILGAPTLSWYQFVWIPTTAFLMWVLWRDSVP